MYVLAQGGMCISATVYLSMHFALVDIMNLCVCRSVCVFVWQKTEWCGWMICLNIPSPLSVMASALTVCVAHSFEATTTRHNTVCLGNSLPLHDSILCTFLSFSVPHISAPSLSSLTVTEQKPWMNFFCSAFSQKQHPWLSLSFPSIGKPASPCSKVINF